MIRGSANPVDQALLAFSNPGNVSMKFAKQLIGNRVFTHLRREDQVNQELR